MAVEISNPHIGVTPAGEPGPVGPSGEVAIGTTATLAAGLPATVTNTGTPSAAVLNFGIPAGQKGDAGGDGLAATISIASTTTGAAGTNASVINAGTPNAASLQFTIPRGDQGVPGSAGSPGAAATVTVGTTTTGLPSTSASVTNSGTSAAAVLNFTIPRGEKGEQGIPGPAGPSRRIVTMSGLTAGGVASFTYTPEFANVPHVTISFISGSTREYARLSASTRFGCTVQAFSQNATLLSLLGIDILTAGTTPISGATIRIMAVEM